jgi:hypothetical protein
MAVTRLNMNPKKGPDRKQKRMSAFKKRKYSEIINIMRKVIKYPTIVAEINVASTISSRDEDRFLQITFETPVFLPSRIILGICVPHHKQNSTSIQADLSLLATAPIHKTIALFYSFLLDIFFNRLILLNT